MDRVRDKIASFARHEESRTVTNKAWIYLFATFLFVLLMSVIYCTVNGDPKRFLNGFDDCGNVCGSRNSDMFIPGCFPSDMRALPLLRVGTVGDGDVCVKSCDEGYIEIFNRCFKIAITEGSLDNAAGEGLRDLVLTLPGIITVGALSVVFSYIVLLMFRYIIDYIIWSIIVAVVTLEVFLTSYFGYLALLKKDDGITGIAVALGVFTLITVLIVFLLRKRINLVGQIFKEAAKALVDVPMIMLQPVFTFVVIVAASVIFYYFLVATCYAGRFERVGNTLVLQQDAFMIAATIMNIIGFLWFCQFVIGCQHFIIAGTISKWYFTRDKTKMSQPIGTAYYNLILYHLGSICLGSWIITLVKIIRMTLRFSKHAVCGKKNVCLCCIGLCIDWIMEKMDDILKYIIRNAFIIVAKDGTPFFESGRKASSMILRNLTNVISLNYIGDLVLVLGRLFIVLITCFVGYEIMNDQPGVNSIVDSMIVGAVISLGIANCFISVFEMTVDTVFLCYCEDCDENDGSASKPYFMSPDLQRIMNELNDRADNSMKFQSLNEVASDQLPASA